MIASSTYTTAPDLFQGKTQRVEELYRLLRDEINKIGPVIENQKETAVSFENRKSFASAIIRYTTIKLIFRLDRRINDPRIHSRSQVTKKWHDHTVVLEYTHQIDTQLAEWLAEAYRAA